MIAATGTSYWSQLSVVLAVTAAIALFSLTLWLFPRRARFGSAGNAVIAALGLTALWSISIAAPDPDALNETGASLAETVRNLSWLLVLYRLFSGDGHRPSVTPVRPVIIALVFVELLHLVLDFSLSRTIYHTGVAQIALEANVMFRLLVTVGALVLVHNLYAGAPHESRPALRWPTIGLAAIWAFDLNLYTVAYLSAHWPVEIASLRSVATMVLAVCFMMTAANNRDELRIRPSRAVTFQTFSLLVIGVYLVAMVAVAQWLSYAGGNFARLIELTFLTLASAIALVVLPSRKVRGLLRVTLTKHFFQHRYDYREEWLRFTRTIGNSGAKALPLGERVVQAIADVTDSPAGLLICPGEQGDLTLAACWNWADISVPAPAIPSAASAFIERTNFITDLDDIRAGTEPLADGLNMPQWLLDDPRAWALVPLVHYERLVGLVVLARPQMARKFDWEDFDLLRVIGQQLASYLAENASQEALAEANRFEDFHRRIAFVMHDIKNLASQFSLLARNAELHADKPAFRADMLVTLRNSSEKLNAMIARLSRYGNGAVEKLEPVEAMSVVDAVMARFKNSPQVMLAANRPMTIIANRHSLEQVLVHLVQNGLDASPNRTAVMISLSSDEFTAQFEVVDCGCGMSAEFVRTRLFKPFFSTKSDGFGIGAFEARELVRAMRGRLDVESREGLGSRFIVRVPLAHAAELRDAIDDKDQKVA